MIAAAISRFLKRRYLKTRGVRCASLPTFIGKWPRFAVEGSLLLGDRCRFRFFRNTTHITARKGGSIEIGDDVFINDGVNICAEKSITIGDHALIGDEVTIYDTNFHQVSPQAAVVREPVVVGRNVWIANHAIVLPGVSIGDHAVVAAHSVVSSSVPPRTVVAGVPARVVMTFECDDDWIRR